MLDKSYFNNINGAVYIPIKAYNAYQMWRDYSSEISKRDMSYAHILHINSLRLWISYEYWLVDKDGFKAKFDDFLDIAASYGIRTMPSLFECCGRIPTKENIEDTDQFSGTAVMSPGTMIVRDKSLWGGPRSFVEWFMDNYRDDERLLAIELVNEPKTAEDELFTIDMLKTACSLKGSRPITNGSNELGAILMYSQYLDIYQTHENFSLSESSLRFHLDIISHIQTVAGKPVWITEWQRLRKSGIGFRSEYVAKEDLVPCHKSMAPIWREYGVGNFVWSLMLKPAYLSGQRKVGTFSGIFHEDGSVYSLADARAVAGDDSLVLEERHEFPAMFDEVAKLSR